MKNMIGIIVDELVKTESSMVTKIARKEKQKKVFVKFKNGRLYRYDNVEKEDYENLKNATSIGRHLQKIFLKKGFKYTKLEENTELLQPLSEEEASASKEEVISKKEVE